MIALFIFGSGRFGFELSLLQNPSSAIEQTQTSNSSPARYRPSIFGGVLNVYAFGESAVNPLCKKQKPSDPLRHLATGEHQHGGPCGIRVKNRAPLGPLKR